MIRFSKKFYILSSVILFVISTTILLVASAWQTPVPAWVGYLDVGIVVLIAIIGFAIYQRDKSARRYDVSYQVATYLFPLVLVVLWVYRDALDFNILLPGIAWRIYFFLSILPHSISLWKSE